MVSTVLVHRIQLDRRDNTHSHRIRKNLVHLQECQHQGMARIQIWVKGEHRKGLGFVGVVTCDYWANDDRLDVAKGNINNSRSSI